MTRLETIYEDVDLEAGEPSRSRERRKRGSCCRCAACLALLVATALAALLGGLYLALDPKLPRYTVHALNVTSFGVDDAGEGLTARARVDAAVRFENPNRAIGIRYEAGSRLAVWFRGYRLAEGALPAFYQGHRDASLVRVAMAEATLRGAGVVEAMRHVNGGDGGGGGGGELPLVFTGDVPVRVKVGPVVTGKVTPSVRCDMVLDRLSTEGSVRVKNMDCKFVSIKLW